MSTDKRNSPDQNFLSEPSTSTTTFPRVPEAPLAPRLTPEIQRLYRWLSILSGFSVLGIAALAGFTIWIKLQQSQLQQQLGTVSTYVKAQDSRLNSIESRINNIDSQTRVLTQDLVLLNQRVSKGIPLQIKALQKDIAGVKTSMQKVAANTVTRQQMNQTVKTLHQQNKLESPRILGKKSKTR